MFVYRVHLFARSATLQELVFVATSVTCQQFPHSPNLFHDCGAYGVSTKEEASRETKRVAKALTANNYPANFIHSDRQLNIRQELNNTDQRGLVILPYAKGFSEKVAKVLRSFSIKVAHKPIRTISNILKKTKRQNRERGFQRNRVQDQM